MLRKRTRTGCFSCRTRRRKCDGARPRCRNCELRGFTCQWGLKASFHPSRTLSLSRHETAALTAIEERRLHRTRQAQAPPTIIDETEEIISDYVVLDQDVSSPPLTPHPSSDRDGTEDPVRSTTPSAASSPQTEDGGVARPDSDTGRTDISCIDLFQPALDSSQRLVGDALSIGDPSPPALPGFACSRLPQPPRSRSFSGVSAAWSGAYDPPFSLGQAISENISVPPQPPLVVSNAERARLISSYMKETGTWCETTDSERHFTVRSIHEMMKSAAFTAAAMSLASRQLDYLERRERPVTLELYQYTIQLLLRQNPAAPDASVLATCTLLCVYEMMASDVNEWRRHLKGCAGLLQVQKWNGSTEGIVKSCFWAFARIDVWASFVTGKTTLIPTNFWLDDMSIESVAAKGNVDDYCNLAILIFAKVINLLGAPDGHHDRSHRSTFAASVSSLWHELQEWRRLRPQEVCPLLRDHSSPGKVFPTILFSRSSSICGNTFYHTGSILLLQTGVLSTATESSPPPIEDPNSAVWHARELAGISISNPSHANWVNHLQPLYIVGTVFAGSGRYSGPRDSNPDNLLDIRSRRVSRPAHGSPEGLGSTVGAPLDHQEAEEYPAEKLILLKHLARIERETGWKTSNRAATLRSLWGLG